jgi:hypothetical protein
VPVVVATFDPFTETVAPKTGFASGPVTFPLTFVCAKTEEERKRKRAKTNKRFVLLIKAAKFLIKHSILVIKITDGAKNL